MIKTREELIYLLTKAAELEHLLVCQYLFAAFSIKRFEHEGLTPLQQNAVDEWGQKLLLISRQEMEHLGLVSNILTSIGAMPHFERPAFPHTGSYYPFPLVLERLNLEAVQRFACVEKPMDVQNPLCKEPAPPNQMLSLGSPTTFTSVAQLYALIRDAITEIPMSDADLFIGPPSAQVGGGELDLDFGRIGAVGGVYDVTLFPVYDRPTALQAVDLITEQGEGTPHSIPDEPSHYTRFLEMYGEMKNFMAEDPSFNPARNIVPNPRIWEHDNVRGSTLITDPMTREVMLFFNHSYELMLMMMIRFYAHTDETTEEINILKYAAFFPFMTMVIRPLGEMLTTMPAFDKQPDGPRAGAGFELNYIHSFLPHKKAAWTLMSERMTVISNEMARVAKLPKAPPGLAYISESIALVNRNFTQNLIAK